MCLQCVYLWSSWRRITQKILKRRYPFKELINLSTKSFVSLVITSVHIDMKLLVRTRCYIERIIKGSVPIWSSWLLSTVQRRPSIRCVCFFPFLFCYCLWACLLPPMRILLVIHRHIQHKRGHSLTQSKQRGTPANWTLYLASRRFDMQYMGLGRVQVLTDLGGSNDEATQLEPTSREVVTLLFSILC